MATLCVRFLFAWASFGILSIKRYFRTSYNMSEDRKIFSLSQLTTSLQNFITKNFAAKAFWVSAEITKISTKGGHYYFELAETQNHYLLAQVQSNLWYSNYRLAKEKYGSTLDEVLQSGNKALFLIRIEYHKIFGLKLNILDIDPSYSFGEMERQKQLNIARLKEEQLYFNQKSLTLHRICRKIAVIGSPDTSGYRDFMKTLLDNDYYTHFKVKSFASSVQGNDAKRELLKQILEAQNYDVDVIVLIRGGGSKTDLNIFNDYDICKAICLSKIPFVTGIGHETDDVVASHVSRLDCITPTAAAKHFYIQVSSFLSDLRSSFDAIIQQSLMLLQGHQIEFNDAQKRLGFWSQELFKQQKATLDDTAQLLFKIVHFNLISKFQDLEIQLMHVEANAQKTLTVARDIELRGQLEHIAIATRFSIDQERHKLNQLDEMVRVLNPLKLLEQGYTISTVNDEDVNKTETLMLGGVLKTLSNKNLITSTITSIETIKNE